ncbi:MAG: uncharacterized protein V7636_995, partial [Actinomycetota bacterium]
GEPIAAKRWSDAQKRKIHDSRVDGTRRVVEAIDRDGVPVLLSGSGVGYYGDCGDEVLTESRGPGDDFLAHMAIDWEAAALSAARARVVLLRTGIVLSPAGGALKKLLPLFKLGLGGRMGSGKQWVSWIALHDHVRAMERLLTSDVRGPVNVVAPNPVTNAAQAKTLGRVLHRPAVLPTPSIGPKLVLGSELASTLLGDSQRATPKVLLEDGFEFRSPDLEGALTSLLR